MESKVNEKLFLEAYDKLSANILRHISFRVNDSSLAEEMTSETFLKAWEYLRNGKNIDNLKSFIYRVANNLVIDYYRTRKPTSVPLEEVYDLADHKGKTVTEEMDIKTDLALVNNYLSTLPEDQKKMVVYRYIDELSVQEISKLTGKTTVNVYVIIHRALKILKQKFKEYEKERQLKINAQRIKEFPG